MHVLSNLFVLVLTSVNMFVHAYTRVCVQTCNCVNELCDMFLISDFSKAAQSQKQNIVIYLVATHT